MYVYGRFNLTQFSCILTKSSEKSFIKNKKTLVSFVHSTLFLRIRTEVMFLYLNKYNL